MESKGSKIPIKHQLKTSNKRKIPKDEKIELVESQNADDEFKFSNMTYESMRSLVERKDRDLDELREFANLERESMRNSMDEEQEKLNLNPKCQAGIDQNQNQSRSEGTSVDSDKVHYPIFCD